MSIFFLRALLVAFTAAAEKTPVKTVQTERWWNCGNLAVQNLGAKRWEHTCEENCGREALDTPSITLRSAEDSAGTRHGGHGGIWWVVNDIQVVNDIPVVNERLG